MIASLILNRIVETTSLSSLRYELTEDGYDDYRKEYNEMITERFSDDQNTFKIEKYVTITTQANQDYQAKRILDDMANVIESQYSSIGIFFKEMDGLERLLVFRKLLRKEAFLDFTYEDIATSGLSTRDFIAPNYIKFDKDHFRIDDAYARVLYVRDYPTFLNDKLIKNILDTGIELAISLHAKPYDTAAAMKKVKTVQSSAKRELIKSQKEAAKAGVPGELIAEARQRKPLERQKSGQKSFKTMTRKCFLE